MATNCFVPVFGKRIRVTRMDSCCNAVTGGSCAEVVTDGFISLMLKAEIENGTEVVTKKANGNLCVNAKLPDAFKRYIVDIEFCGVDPALLSFLTNTTQYLDYNGNINGILVNEGLINGRFGLEVWTGLSGTACPTGVQEASGLFTIPCINAGILSDLKVDEKNAISFTMTGAFTIPGNAWGRGVHKVIQDQNNNPAILPSAIGPNQPLLVTQTGISPPPSACGCAPFNAAV